ncbi:MAG: sigma-70 family RNA polymerase sigma factor [Hyphomicrobiales bacterium]
MIETDQREAERFRRLALPLLDEVYSFARYLTRDATEAEDAAQETYLRALRYFSGFSGESIKPWLFTILRNVLRSRDPRRFEPLPETQAGHDASLEPLWGDPADDPEAIIARTEEAKRLRRLIGSLPPIYREVLLLKEFNELSYRQIAVVTSVPIGTVMSRLARAREELQRAWFELEKKAR